MRRGSAQRYIDELAVRTRDRGIDISYGREEGDMIVSMITRHRSMASRRFLPWVSLTASLVVVFSLFGPIRNLGAQGKRSVNNGVYTEAQAKRGEQIFNGVGRCYECHLRNLQGDAQRKGKPLAGPDFLSDWTDKSVDDLFYKVQYTMPTDIRGSGTLPVEQVADLVAFLLQRNGYPAGFQELATDRGQLKMIAFDMPKQTSGAPAASRSAAPPSSEDKPVY